jgi:serine/threonine protein kinase
LFEGRACIDDFDVGVTLGTGSFGRVRFAIHRATGKRCAIKMLKKAEVMKFQQVRFNVVALSQFRECALMNKQTSGGTHDF